jgi:DedD protein
VAGSTRGRGTGNDPLLPEKKRARRRLVGAIALALAAAVGLPMLLDSEPKPLAGDIAIQIPSKDKAAPLPVPSVPASGVPASETSASVRDKAIAAEDSVDKGEEVLRAPPAAKAAAVPKAELPKPEHKPERKPEARPETRPEHKEAPKPEHKPAKPRDDVRAMAILEGKAAEKADKEKPAESSSQKFVLQVAALSSHEKVVELQARLRAAGISSHLEKASTAAGELIRVKVGPLNKEEAEKVRAKLSRLGLAGAMTPI